MRKLYALLVLALTMGFCLSDSQAQSYTMQSYLVRSIPNDFQDISGVGTDITADMSVVSIYDIYSGRISNKEYTIPFNFRWENTVSNKIRINAHGSIIHGGFAEVPQSIQYLYTYYYYYIGYYRYYSGNYQYGTNNLIAPYNGLCLATAETKWHMAITGSAPNRVVVVQTAKVEDYPFGAGNYAMGSWQVKLFESGISRVEFAYRNDRPASNNWNAYNYTYYGPYVGGTGKPFTVSTSPQYPPYGSVLWIKSQPAAGGTPTVSYDAYSYYDGMSNQPVPVVGYRVFIAFPYDLAAAAITNPLLDQIRNKDQAFTPTGVISNEGSLAPTTATVNRRTTLFGVGQVYNQSITITPPAAFTSTNVSFPSFTPLSYGIYYDTMEVISTSPADQSATNNITVTTYVVSPPNNLKAISVNNPAPGSRTPINIPTPVGATFRNLGANGQINAPVSMVIYNPAGQVVYRDTVRFPSISSSQFRDTTFRDWTPTQHGVYRFCAIAIMATDQLRADDTVCSEARVAYENDAAAVVITSPEADQELPEKKVFKIFAKFSSVGVADLFDIPARLQIRRCSDNALVFQADSTIPELNVDAGAVTFGFPTKQGSTYDVTKLAPGCYNACVIARYQTDGDRANDTACTTFSVIPQLSGNIEVGRGRRFPTINAAVDSMRFRGVGGPLTLILTDSYYRENGLGSTSSPWGAIDFNGIIGTSENVQVTWKPKAGVSPRIAFYGNKPASFYFGPGSPSYMTFDGMNQLNPTPELLTQDASKRGITIVDSSSVAGSTIAVEHGFANNMTFKNLKIIGRGMLTNDSSSVFRLFNERSLNTFTLNRITDTMPNHHITIENNEMGNAAYGIYDRGLAPLFSVGPAKFFDRRNYSNRFVRNAIGTSAWALSRAGIAFDNEQDLLISMNDIQNVNATLAGGGKGAGIMEIGVGNVERVSVNGNKVHNITGTTQTLGVQFAQNSTVFTQGTGPNQARSVLPTTTANRVTNNMIWDLKGTVNVVPVSFSTLATNYWTNNDSVYNNSISTNNALYNIYMGQIRHPFVKNNAIQNTSTNASGANFYFEVPRPFATRFQSDYNLFDLAGQKPFAMLIERDSATGNLIQSRTFRRLNDWRTFTGQDAHSVVGNPQFTLGTTGDLHLPGALSYIPSPASNNGVWINTALQQRDIDGDTRQAGNLTPDIGADEVEGFELNNDLAVMAIFKPAGYSTTSDTTFVVTENPMQVQALVKNLSQTALYNRTVNARIEVALNGGAWNTIWSAAKSGLTFDLNESKTLDFTGPMITEQQEQQGVFRVTIWTADDQNNQNNTQTKSFRVMIKRQATLVSYDASTARGLANKDSATRALKRLGVPYDSLNRQNFTTVDIDYSPWWTVVYTVGDAASSTSGGLSFRQTEELTRYLGAGRTYAKKSLVLAGQNIAFYNDLGQINANGVTDREFTRGLLHMRYVANAPVAGSYADTIDGRQVYFQFREFLNATTPDVVAKTINTAPVGEEVSGIAYSYRNHSAVPSDSAAGTTWAGKTFNVVFFAFDWADVKQSTPGEQAILTSGATRVMRGALDFIQSFRGTVLPVNFVNVDVRATETGNEISWKTGEQKDVARFEVERLVAESLTNGEWTKAGEVNAKTYSYTDQVTANGTYSYRVVAVDLDGSRTMSQVQSVTRTSENGFSLMQNYPNPMVSETQIGFTLAEPAMVTINVLDVTGKVVATVVSQNYSNGNYSEPLNAELANGTYVYEMTALTASGQTIKLARKMTVNK